MNEKDRRKIEMAIWDAAIVAAADEADRHAPLKDAAHCDLALRILRLRDITPPRSEWLSS